MDINTTNTQENGASVTNPAHSFKSLTHEDGAPDILARRAALEHLISSLTLSEIRDVRSQLNKIEMKRDIIAALPIEIVSQIVHYFDLETFIKAYCCVSKEWRAKLSNEAICTGMVKKHFPTAYCKDVSKDVRLLLDLARAHERRRRGAYYSMSIIKPEYEVFPSKENCQYKRGKVAWKRNHSIVVYTLRTGLRKAYMDDNRLPIRDWELSNKYLVGQTRNPPSLTAWSLNDDSSYKVKLPSIPQGLSVQNDIVIVITGAAVLKWDIGGAIELLDTSQATPYFHNHVEGFLNSWSATATAFHPMADDHFFLIYQPRHITLIPRSWNGLHGNEIGCNIGRRIVIQEFVEGKSKAIYYTDDNELGREDSGSLEEQTSIRPNGVRVIDANGTLAINCSQDYYTSTDEPIGRCSHPNSIKAFALITFNMYSKAFGQRFHHAPKGTRNFLQVHIWDNELYFPMLPQKREEAWINDTLEYTNIAVFKTCDKIADEKRLIPFFRQDGSKKFISWCRDIYHPCYGHASDNSDNQCHCPAFNHQCGASFGWLVTSGEGQPGRDVYLTGDDDFVVAFSGDKCLVWCFDKNFRSPKVVQSQLNRRRN